jgi:formamidopyrimidine-DNA glycosylase
MPELPDVEIFRQYAEKTSMNQKIQGVEPVEEKVLEKPPNLFREKLQGMPFHDTRRIGKHLLMHFNGEWLAFHFGMTGFFQSVGTSDNLPRHSRFVIHFNQHKLCFINSRKLGKVDLTDDIDRFMKKKDIGPDVLEVTGEDFLEGMKTKRGKIKSALMDQGLFSGIGNIYSDEILFQARVHPGKKVHEISKEGFMALHEKTREVMEAAIQAGAKPENFPSHFFIPHREEGGKCPNCKGKVEKLKISGRGCYVCPKCQLE